MGNLTDLQRRALFIIPVFVGKWSSRDLSTCQVCVVKSRLVHANLANTLQCTSKALRRLSRREKTASEAQCEDALTQRTGSQLVRASALRTRKQLIKVSITLY